jgi:hypothetical protein
MTGDRADETDRSYRHRRYKIAAGIVREDGTVLHRTECPTEARRGFREAVHRMQQMLQEAIARCGPIDGVGRTPLLLHHLPLLGEPNQRIS